MNPRTVREQHLKSNRNIAATEHLNLHTSLEMGQFVSYKKKNETRIIFLIKPAQ